MIVDVKPFLVLLKNTLCRTCLGCNRLDLSYFQGVKKCSNYRKSNLDRQVKIEDIIYL